MVRRNTVLTMMAAVAVGLGCGQATSDGVECAGSEICTLDGLAGQCIAAPSGASWCAYPSSECPSGWVWSRLSGDELSGECVEPGDLPGDGGVADASGEPDGGADASFPDAGLDAAPDAATCVDEVPACTAAVDLGLITADSHAEPAPYPTEVERLGADASWYVVRLAETIGSGGGPLQARITVVMDEGADYDVVAYCLACGGPLAGIGTPVDDSGPDEFEFLDIRRNDLNGDQSFDVLIEVTHVEGTACGYTVHVERTAVEAATCN